MSDEKPRYRVLALSLIGNDLVQPGVEIDNYNGYPAENLEPLNDAARAKAAEYVEVEKRRVAELERLYGDKGNGAIDPVALSKAIGAAIADAMAQQAAETEDLKRRLAEAEARLAKVPAADLT